jgi:hypothetical protein
MFNRTELSNLRAGRNERWPKNSNKGFSSPSGEAATLKAREWKGNVKNIKKRRKEKGKNG